MAQAQAPLGALGAQYEATYGVVPTADSPAIAADLTKLYAESEGFKSSRNMISSNILTGSRQPSQPGQGNTDVTGSIQTELQAYAGMLYYAAAGSVKTTLTGASTGETLGSALTTPTATLNSSTQEITVASTGHGLAVGATVKFAGLTSPTSLNDCYCRVTKVPTADSFVARLPLGVSGTFTLGSGTVKACTVAATAGYTHVFKFGGYQPSLYINKGFTDIGQYFGYSGCKCSRLGLNISPEGFQKLSLDFAGRKEETVAQAAYDATATDLTKFSWSGFQIASIVEGAATTLANVTKVDLTVENNLDTSVFVIGGGGFRGGLPSGICKVSGTLECLFEDVTLYNKAIAGTESALKITYTAGTGAGTSGNENLEIFLPELIFTREAPVISGDKGVLVTLPFEAFYANSSEAAVMQWTLKNTGFTL